MTITNETYADKAENAIKELKNMKNEKTGKTKTMVSTSKLRNLLAMISDIYNEVMNQKEDKLNEEIRGRINYLKVRFVYEVGRDKENKVRDFVDKTEILKCLGEINGSKKNFILFSRYMEALVAYHRYYGGKDI